MKTKIYLSKSLAIFIIVLHISIRSSAQKIDDHTVHKQKLGLEYKTYGIGVLSSKEGRERKGLNAFYSWQILGSNKHQVSVSPQIGFVFDPGIQTRLLQTVSIDYNFNLSKRLELGAFFGVSHVLTKLAFDRYEYNKKGDFENRGKFRGQLSPSYGGKIGWKLIKKANYSISPYAALSFIKLDRSYNGNIQGFKRSASIGLTLNF